MPQTLMPIVSSSIEYHTSPVNDPPPIDFPYPEPGDPSHSSGKGNNDSNATSAETRSSLPQEGLVANRGQVPQDEAGRRSRPTNEQFRTQISSPVTTQAISTQSRDRNSGTSQTRHTPLLRNNNATSPSDSSSDSGFSTDNEEETSDHLQQQRSLPEHGDLGPRQLNRARMRPRNERLQHIRVGNQGFKGQGKIAKDGRLNVKINETANTGYLAKALGTVLHGHLHPHAKKAKQDAEHLQKHHDENKSNMKIPRMNIVIMVIGSRGDVQPFLKIGKILRDKYGHRVRIATHPTFRSFVQDEIGLEFFSIGGDPSELMSFMVRNPGLIPSFGTLTSGEVGRRREQMYEMFNGFWRACVNTTDAENDTANLKLLGNKHPFVADAIIANPVSFAHYHCAEKLGIPLHLIFTFPYTPTTAFPHPLANIKASNVDREYSNYMSYPLVELMQWQGLGDLVNRFRVKTLGLEPLSTLWAPGQITRMRVPVTYLWSPGLVPKPEDWGPEIDIAGYVFLDLAKSYKPPTELRNFLERSEKDSRPIIYIGFGSISGIDDATAFCQLIFDAAVKAGVRAVVSRGWGGMGDGMDIPDGVLMIDNVPHDWLFPQLDAVVHHGGAGTTAAGLKLGIPTMIVPFFGDQPFWASMIARSGAGAKNVWPLKKLTVDRFAASIKDCLEPSAKENAQAIAKSIASEGDGAENAIDSFHRGLNLSGKHSMRCSIFDDRVAVWHVKHTDLRLSALAAVLLVENNQLNWNDLGLLRHKQWADFSGPGEPITGAGGVVVSAFQEALHGVSDVHETTKADLKKIEQRRRSEQGLTVAHAITMPGKVATQARISNNAATGNDEALETVNLIGSAEPVRRPTIAGMVGKSGKHEGPHRDHAERRSSLNGPAPVVLAKDVGRGFGHSFKAIVLLPMDVLNAITLGFRNAPRLYGDRTVRPPPQNIKGFRQGVSVAGKELWFGIYDGTTGLVKIPYLDVSEDGISGLPKGVARGLGGLVLKPVAGALGLVNYTNRGCYASLRRRFRDTEKTERWIKRIRLAQGSAEVQELQDQDQAQRKPKGQTTVTSGHAKELERARTQAMSRWTAHDREQLREARAREKRSMSIIPKRSSKSEDLSAS